MVIPGEQASRRSTTSATGCLGSRRRDPRRLAPALPDLLALIKPQSFALTIAREGDRGLPPRPWYFSATTSWASPERAIDGDLIHDLLKDSQLFLAEPRDEQIGDPAHVDRRRLGQAGHARIGQYDHDATCVCFGVGSTNEAFVNHPRDTASHARTRDERAGGEVGHAELPTSGRKLTEHIEIGQRHTGLFFEIRVE